VQYDKNTFLDLADDVDRQHREGMASMSDDLHEIHFEGPVADELRENRRDLFKKVAIGGGVLTAATLAGPLSGILPSSWAADAPSDADLARFAQSLELAAVAAYKAAAGTGKLDATATSVGTLFAGHHQDHADAFTPVLGDQAVTEPNQKVLDKFGPMIASAPDQAAILDIARMIEEGAASTYLLALGIVSVKPATLLATILPVESQHATVLATVLKMPAADYLPSFVTVDNALQPTDYPVS
jgi:hypothetical protein